MGSEEFEFRQRPELTREEFESEALVFHAHADGHLARRLRADLEDLGVRASLLDFDVFDFDSAFNRRLGKQAIAPTLVVLWTEEAARSDIVLEGVEAFVEASADLTGGTSLIPVFVGRNQKADAPPRLLQYQGLVVDAGVSNGAKSADKSWRRAVLEIAARLQPEERLTRGRGSPSLGALDAFRVSVSDSSAAGWVLGEDLAVVSAAADLPRRVEVTTPSGLRHATTSRFPTSAPFNGLDGFAVLEFDVSLRPIKPPLGMDIEPGLNVQLWGSSARSYSGKLGVSDSAGDFELDLSKEDRAIEQGSAVWSPKFGYFLGIAVFAGEGRWRLLPVARLRELAAGRRGIGPDPPSARIHDDSWTIKDNLDHALYARAIREFIQHPDTRPPLVIGVQGPWGQGKTSLMRLVQDRLDPGHPDLVRHRQQQSELAAEGPSELTFKDLRDSLDGDVELDGVQSVEVRTVWFNPWKYQSSEALWAGLANAILSQLPARLPRRKQELFWLQLQARRIDVGVVRSDIHHLVFERLLPGLLLSVAAATIVAIACVVVGLAAALSALGSVTVALLGAGLSWGLAHRRALQRPLEGSYLRYVRQPDYSGKLGYFHYVEEDMRRALDLLAPAKEPTVIFIDDLDRCSSSRIGEVLEAINLFLSGEYPNCFFVLGIDAQVVASAMEIVHRAAFGSDEGASDFVKDHLGWRFLDKFIQLSFVMPRISETQRRAYLETLLGVDREVETGDAGGEETVPAAADVLRRVEERDLDPDQAVQELGELQRKMSPSKVGVVHGIAEEVITRGASRFRDSDPETVAALEGLVDHLSDNPRTIKRAVNLYRFYRFLSWAREASAAEPFAVDIELIARWTVVAARWPHAVHWLQVNGRGEENPWAALVEAMRGEEPELCRYLEGMPEFDLRQAMVCGLW